MHRWKLSALAAAAFVSVALAPTSASALTLGSLRVQSALGQNLRAEIAVPQITAQELASLDVKVAPPELFRSQGMDYSSAARSIQVQVQRNADGSATLLLSSDAPVNDPFVDLVIQSNWHAGNLVRTYTLLLDPPATLRPTPVAPAQITPAPVPAAAAPTPAAPASVTGRTYSSNAATAQPATTAAPKASAPAAITTEDATPDALRVRAGDTAGRIANANRPRGVSLDQMLVAMLRSNPDAFINGNVNRIRAGAVVQMPSRAQALETSATEARQIVAAQSRDFNSYRRSLASKAPEAQVQAAERSSGGQVQARVEDTRPAAATPDKLTLSKGAVTNAAPEAQLAADKQAAEQDNRLSELQRNLAELNQLAQNNAAPATMATAPATEAPAPTATAPVAEAATALPAAPAIEVTTPTLTAADSSATPAPATPLVDTAETTNETAAAPAPSTAAAVVENTEPAAAPATEPAPATPTPSAAPATPAPSMANELMANPLVPAGGAIVALLLGLLGYRSWKRRRDAAQVATDPAAADASLAPDSFFGSSGGQQVDTSSAEVTGAATTMAYSPSQLDGGGDVDPVAEADVYLAYGRDVQAEEILKEALRTQPERLSVHLKLAEIYVKRSDVRSLERTARGLQNVSQPNDPEWQRVVAMGRELDPNNEFFAQADNGAATAAAPATSAFAQALDESRQASAALAGVAAASAATAWGNAPATNDGTHPAMDLDIDLSVPPHLDADESNASAAAEQTFVAPPPSDADFAALELPASLDSQLDVVTPPAIPEPPTLVQDSVMDTAAGNDLSNFDLDLSGFNSNPDFGTPAAAAPSSDFADLQLDTPSAQAPDFAPAPSATPAAEPVMPSMEFDLGSLDLDLGTDSAPANEPQPVHNLADDPLSTKLDLAQEFNNIGDSEGARALIEEVLAEASGPLKDRAQKMLSEID